MQRQRRKSRFLALDSFAAHEYRLPDGKTYLSLFVPLFPCPRKAVPPTAFDACETTEGVCFGSVGCFRWDARCYRQYRYDSSSSETALTWSFVICGVAVVGLVQFSTTGFCPARGSSFACVVGFGIIGVL